MKACLLQRFTLSLLVVLAGAAATRPAIAAADGTGPSAWVPWVKFTPSVATHVAVLNQGVDDVDLKITLIDARSGGAPITCTAPPAASPLPPGHTVDLDLATQCAGLPASGGLFDGALQVLADVPGGRRPARIAAVARWLVIDRASGRREQEIDAPALPLSALPGLAAPQRIDVVAHDDVSRFPVSTECQFAGAPASAPAARKIDLRLERNGVPLGSPATLSLAPGSAENVPDLFALMGVGGAAFPDVQLVVSATAQPEIGLSVVCSVVRQRGGRSTSPAITLHAGLPLDGATLVRRHTASVVADAGGRPLVVTGTENALHHVFLRHQDRLSCSVRPTDPQTSADALRIAAVPPDRSRTLGGTGTDLVLEDTGTRAGTALGLGGAWALIVEQTVPDPALGIAYRITCSAGNGVSPPLRVAVSPTPLPRP